MTSDIGLKDACTKNTEWLFFACKRFRWAIYRSVVSTEQHTSRLSTFLITRFTVEHCSDDRNSKFFYRPDEWRPEIKSKTYTSRKPSAIVKSKTVTVIFLSKIPCDRLDWKLLNFNKLIYYTAIRHRRVQMMIYEKNENGCSASKQSSCITP